MVHAIHRSDFSRKFSRREILLKAGSLIGGQVFAGCTGEGSDPAASGYPCNEGRGSMREFRLSGLKKFFCAWFTRQF